MMVRFTKRPWKATLDSNGDYVVSIGGIRRVLVEGTGEDDDNVGADAHLIAAAPDMFEALKRMVAECKRYLEERPVSESDMYNPEYVSPLTQARAALAKARGDADA